MNDNFLGLEHKFSNEKDSKIIILPIPFDKTTTYIKGSDKGPKALIKASQNLELYDIHTDQELYKLGIHTLKPEKFSSSEDMIQTSYEKVKYHLNKNKFVVTLGGEHSISIVPIKAHAEHYKSISVVQFDAHSDLRPSYEGSKHNHACIMSRVHKLEDVSNTISIGIRSMDISEKPFMDLSTIFFAHDIYNNDSWMEKALSQLNDLVYITFDLDAFDSSIMPSTGTPEPGGLIWHQVINFIKLLSKRKKIIGFDIVELCPIKNFAAPDFLAAKLTYQILNFAFHKGA